MSIGSLGQAIELDLGRTHCAHPIQFDNTFEMPASPPNGRSQRRYIGTLWFRRLRARSDEGGATARFEYRERLLRDIASDGVEDSVAIGDSLREIAGFVIDDLIGTEPPYIVIVCRTCSRDHMRADVLGQLDGKTGNSASPALDQ